MKVLLTIAAMFTVLTLAAPNAIGAEPGVFDFNPGVGSVFDTTVGEFTGLGSWIGVVLPGGGPGGSLTQRVNMIPTTTGSPGLDTNQAEPYGPGLAVTNIDDPWIFFGVFGAHFTTGPLPVNLLDDTTALVDMSEWWIVWNSQPVELPLGAGLDAIPGTVDDFMTVSAGADGLWNTGDEYGDYSSVIPPNDPSGLGGIGYVLHLEGSFDPTPSAEPGILVSINVAGGLTQECAAPGGSTVALRADVTLLRNAELQSVTWKVDGSAAGTGLDIQPFLSLGSHNVMVTAEAVTGQTAAASVSVEIEDTTPPDLDVAFIDSRSGERITQIERANVQWVVASYPASDVCDPAPATQGVGGFAVTDGDVLKIQGNNDTVMLTTSEITLSATATDASGNTSSGNASLSLTQ